MIRYLAMSAVLLSVAPTLAQEPGLDVEGARKAVEMSARRYAEAFAKRDPVALAALFTPEAEYVDLDGTVFHGRGVIQAEYAARLAVNPPGEIDVELLSIRPIANGVLVEEGISTFAAAAGDQKSSARYTATHVRQPNGNWLIASVREIASTPLTPHDRLQSLAWLVGNWHEDVGGNSIVTQWNWADSGNFLVSDITINRAGIETRGTHRIGWNAEQKQFRSWVFDSTGASGEGYWQMNDDGTWTLNLTRIDAEGSRSVARLTFAADGKDAMVVSLDQQISNGTALAGGMHRIVRRPPEPRPSAK